MGDSDREKSCCEKCQFVSKSPHGLTIHMGRVHGKLGKQNKPTKLKMNEEKELIVKKLKIKERLRVNWKNVFTQYKKKQSKSAKFIYLFKYPPEDPEVDFKNFDQNLRDYPAYQKKVKEMIFSPKNDITSFWTSVMILFRKDLTKYSKNRNINLELFNLENTEVENYTKNVQSYRQITDVCYEKIVSLFDLKINDEKKNEEEEMNRNQVVEKLSMLKLQLEMILDISLAVKFYQSNTFVKRADKITNDKEKPFAEKKDKVTKIFNYLSFVIHTVDNINIKYVQEYESILVTIKSLLSKQKEAIQMFLHLIDSEIILTRTKKIQEQVETQKTDIVNDEDMEILIPKQPESEVITIHRTEYNLEDSIEMVTLEDNCNESENKKQTQSEVITIDRTEKNLEKSIEMVTLEDNSNESDQNDGFENDTIDDNLLLESTKQDKITLDLSCLYGTGWLKDDVAQKYLQMCNTYNQKILIYDTLFIQSLQNYGFDKFTRFNIKEDPLNKEGLLIPVHEPKHWYLIFFNNKTFELFCFDPFNFPTKTKEERKVKLEETFKKRMKILETVRDCYLLPLFESVWHFSPDISLKVLIPPNLPEQNDCHNCGIFMLAFAKATLLGKKFDFSSEDIENFRQVIIDEITNGKPTRKIKQDEASDEDTVEAQNQHQENNSTAICIEKEEKIKEASVEEKPQNDFSGKTIAKKDPKMEENEETRLMLIRAISSSSKHGINLTPGKLNPGLGNCAFESVLYNINERACFEEKYESSADYYRRIWMTDMEEKMLENPDWNCGYSEKEIKIGFSEVKISGVYERGLFGDLILPGIAVGVHKMILIFNTHPDSPHDPISVIHPESFGGYVDSNIPIVLAYNLEHFESMHPVSDEDVTATQNLAQSYLDGSYKFSHADIPSLIHVVSLEDEKDMFNIGKDVNIHTVQEIQEVSITETPKSIEFENVSKENESKKTFEQLGDLDQLRKEDLVQEIYDDIFNKLIINEEADNDDLHVDQNGHCIEQFHDDTVPKGFKERDIEEAIKEIVDDDNSDIVTPPPTPYQSDKQIQIEKKRKLEENVADENSNPISKFLKLDKNDGMETEDFVSNRGQPSQDDINNPLLVDNNLIQYPRIKIFGDQKMLFYLDLDQYKTLSKNQQQKISDKFEGKVSYKGKALNRRRNFKADPALSMEFLEHYQTYIKNETVIFHVHVNFKIGDIQSEQHEQSIFVENSLFRPENINKKNNETYPKHQMKFQNVTIKQFERFLNIFK